MPDTTRIGTAPADDEAEAFAALLTNGYLRIYDSTGGTGQPATVDTAIGSQVLLAELRFATPAEASIVDGVVTFDALAPETDAPATGAATWFRAFAADGTTPIWDGSVGVAGETPTLVMPTTAIQEHAQVDITSLTYTVTKG